MREVNILGCSYATVSLLLESLFRCHGAGLRVKVIQNVPVGDVLPFEIDGVETKVLDHDTWDAEADRDVPCLCGVTTPAVKRAVFEFFASRYGIGANRYAILTHPSAEIAATARMGAGVHAGPGTVLAPYAQIGERVSINRGAMVGHHTKIGTGSAIQPGVQIAGHCEVGDDVLLGVGAVVVDGVRIGDGAAVAAGALVRKTVAAGALVAGVPARALRRLR